ncbi:DUF4179 domain-containing protein [Sedimentibacter sp. zth1]|uniref:DUF4179 domain-containing protein n=1 Tax=Sedimentibacter sp. zth1 TaxID=2816908 RepID=UPI001A93864C|nr:DUF4179 domain-containing protein [Sedimentibacter sp. zth1]QSX06633.1 DUF4179 domain-containing protein [Sedimentibacter sp. zth1]
MNRIEELNNLKDELNAVVPNGLENVEKRFKKKVFKRRIRNCLCIPISSLLMILAIFTCFVNFVPEFAYACAELPILRDLASAVKISPSLEKAFENDYVQKINQSQTINGITATVKYAIVDEDEINIFYTLESETYKNLYETSEIKSLDGNEFNTCFNRNEFIRKSNLRVANSNIDKRISFFMNNFSEGFIFSLDVFNSNQENEVNNNIIISKNEEKDYIANFKFDIKLNPDLVAKSEYISLNKTFYIDNQKLILEYIKISPSNMKLKFKDDIKNTAWLKGLTMYVLNENGERFDYRQNGTIASAVNSKTMDMYYLESPYFFNNEHLTLNITQAEWVENSKEKVKIYLEDIEKNNFENQPYKLIEAFKEGKDWVLAFEGSYFGKNHFVSLGGIYYDEVDKGYYINEIRCYHKTYRYRTKQDIIDIPEYHEIIEIRLTDYPYKTVFFLDDANDITKHTELKTPIKIKIK